MPFGRDPHYSDEDLSAYLDEQVDAGELERCRTHVAACAQCADALEGLRSVRMSLRSLPRHTAPRSFRIRQAQVEEARPVRQPFLARAMPLLSGVSVVAIVAFLALAGITASVGGEDSSGDSTTALRSEPENAVADSSEPSAPVPEAGGEGMDQAEGATTVGTPALYDASTEQARALAADSATAKPEEQEDASGTAATTGSDGDETLLYVAMGLTAVVALASGGLAFMAWRQRRQLA